MNEFLLGGGVIIAGVIIIWLFILTNDITNVWQENERANVRLDEMLRRFNNELKIQVPSMLFNAKAVAEYEAAYVPLNIAIRLMADHLNLRFEKGDGIKIVDGKLEEK